MPTRRTGRGGVEVRVFGGKLGDNRNTGRPQADWIDEESEESPVEVEEVVRLDHEVIPLANRRIENEDPESPDSLPRPQRKRVLSLGMLTILMACLAVMLSVIVVFAAGALKKDPPGPESFLEAMRVIDEPEDEFNGIANADELIEDAMKVFRDYAAARTVDEAIGSVRNGKELRSKLEEDWKPLGETVGEAVGLTGRLEEYKEKIIVRVTGSEVEGEEIEYLLVSGANGFEVDWEALAGSGDVDFDQLNDLEIGRSVKMRLVLKSATFHPLDFPDEEFRSYKMTQLNGSRDVFGYARIGSEVALILAQALNEGSVLLEEVSGFKAIVRLKNEGRGEFGQFTITEVVEEGWVEP